MSDKFLGAWLVSEYIYNPDGRFTGIIQQRRELTQLANGRIRVVQHCTPDAALATHPMNRFAGEWVFELSIDGRYRHYHGPAVIGLGLSWGDGAMTGSGVWPTFGYNFHSFGVLPTPDRQLTGGKFLDSVTLVANIAGIAIPETDGATHPTLGGTTSPAEISWVWNGRYRAVAAANGTLQQESDCERRYSEYGRWRDIVGTDSTIFDIQEQTPTNRIIGGHERKPMIGLVKQFGWLTEATLINSKGQRLEMMELLDTIANNLITIRRWYHNEMLEKVEIYKLQPSE